MCVKVNENGVLNSQNWYNTGGLMAEVYNIVHASLDYVYNSLRPMHKMKLKVDN